MAAGQATDPPFFCLDDSRVTDSAAATAAYDPDRLRRLAALKADARQLIASGKAAEAADALQAATALDVRDIALWLNLAGVQRAVGDLAAALRSVDAALALDPKSFLGLLMKGSLLERSGQARAAAAQYGRAIAQAPNGGRVDASTDAALRHAQQVYQRYLAELGRHVRDELGARRAAAGDRENSRIDLFIDATLGVRRVYAQQPIEYCYPGLAAIEFHDREDFPWLAGLEAQTASICDELLAVVKDSDDFTPYIAYPDGVPLDQWAALNRSPRWSAYHLFLHGERVADHAARCPITMAALADVPQPQAQGRMPAAMFSLLRPQTRIPPHTGVANVRLVVHLPLIVPPNCGFRVGNQTRPWREGEAWVFDDTIEHEAWNDSDQDRYVFIFDVWNPRLSGVERQMITAVMAAMDRYNDAAPDGSL